DPLRWRLVEPRRVRTNRLQDWLWARVLDVPAVLAARSYAVEGALVLDVVDRFRPASGGRFRLDGGPDGATCVPTTAGADLTLGAPELGALVFGGVTASTLAGAGRVDVHDDAARSRADLMFTSTRAPYCNTHF
ncbi:MAG: family N-acetyltransferase, partial [Acidimicrobiales bacterium]|nr:family N-acetyltransferase [Acidimicrobiales bacterium]